MRTHKNRVAITRSSPGRLAGPGSLATASIGDGRRWPAIAAALALLLLIGALVLLLTLLAAPAPALADYRLDGDRAPGCLRVVVLRDQSGSMVDHALAREQAMSQFAAWVVEPDVLRADDELAVVDWASGAALALPVTTVGNLSGDAPSTATVLSDGTDVNAAVGALAALPVSACEVAVVFLTDGLSERLTDDSRRLLTEARVTSVTTIVPAGLSVPAEWRHDFPYGSEVAVSADDFDGNARAIAEVVAASTGQRLAER
jgi:hypothetical protein